MCGCLYSVAMNVYEQVLCYNAVKYSLRFEPCCSVIEYTYAASM